MRKQIWLSVGSPVPFALLYYLHSREVMESILYYFIFVLLISIAMYFHKRKPNDPHKHEDKHYDDYMI